MNESKKAIVIALAFLLITTAIGGTLYFYKKSPIENAVKKAVSSKNKKGLQFRLSEGESELPKPIPVVDAKPLSDSDAESLLSRLEPIKSEDTDKEEFAIRENSLPPPKTGQVINTKFPPDKNIKVLNQAIWRF
ncbi:MAG: hypothetical protein FD167_6100 [bacterium]|nr:MAG: hypothetical protein FD167_6100 [bacterium]